MREVCLLITLFALGGCGAAPPPMGMASIEAMNDFVVGAPTPPTKMHPLPLAEGETTFRIVAGDGGGKVVAHIVTRVDDAESPWRRDVAGRQIQHLRQSEDGTIEMTAVEDINHNVLTRFATPLVLASPKLEPGKPLTQTSAVTVVRRDDPTSHVDRGECEWTVALDADQRLAGPAGEFDCHRLRAEYRGKFSVARVVSVTYQYVNDDRGLVGEYYDERTTALVMNWRKTYTILRVR